MKFSNLVLVTGLLTASAQASTPQGAVYGSWRVISISSMSGTEGNDAAVMITQEVEGAELTARWQEGDRIRISADIKDCLADEDLEQRYAIPLSAWQALSIRARTRLLKRTFVTWIEQARISCTKRSGVDSLQFRLLKQAINDFVRRLDYFAPK